MEFFGPKVRIQEVFLESLHLPFEFLVGNFQVSFSSFVAGLRLSFPINHSPLAALHSACHSGTSSSSIHLKKILGGFLELFPLPLLRLAVSQIVCSFSSLAVRGRRISKAPISRSQKSLFPYPSLCFPYDQEEIIS